VLQFSRKLGGALRTVLFGPLNSHAMNFSRSLDNAIAVALSTRWNPSCALRSTRATERLRSRAHEGEKDARAP
jgi:hypothetical protein